nr:hypothetical protein [Neobacillus sp. Marseille-Q6967]
MSLNQTYFFSTCVSDIVSENDFVLEFFENVEQQDTTPWKITKTFDELIDFLEQIED